MKRMIVAIVCMLAFGAVSVGAGSAGTGSDTTPFKATYVDAAYGTLTTCSGAHVVQKSGTVKDSETCILSGDTRLVVPGTYVGNPSYELPPTGATLWFWASDFNGVKASSVTLVVVDNGDGTFTENVVAYY